MDLEKSILGGVLCNNDKLLDAIDIINFKDFATESHRLIFQAMNDLYDNNEPIDVLTVYEKLNKKVSIELLSSLGLEVNTGANVEAHCRLLRDKSIIRQIKSIPLECKSDDAFEMLEEAERKIMDIGLNGKVEVKRISSVVDEVTDHLYKIKNGTIKQDGVMSGLYDLDDIIHGFKKTELIILAGRPGSGKTAFALHLAKQCNTLFFSLEMADKELTIRLLSSELGEIGYNINSGKFNDSEYLEASKIVSELPLHISDKPGQSLQQIRTTSRKICHKNKIDMIVVDYLQLMDGNGFSREDIISKISRGMKGLAKELKVPVLCLSQLNRAVEGRPNKRPMLSDLRESGSIEQDADVVMFMYRDEYYGILVDSDGKSTENVAEMIIAKQRNGVTKTAKVLFEKQYMRFKNLETNITKPIIF